ncbi:MAG TPA: phosphate ABC transporter ATP-binding protein PstB [Gemmatimonadaceae bacterium]|nr:phosphate ABC transporter ATP-binding protein PstB [Gemmatimonadaceae bacterium]
MKEPALPRPAVVRPRAEAEGRRTDLLGRELRGTAESEAAARQLATEGLDAWFGQTHAVRGVTIEFADHRVTAVIGPSGCGKSTLLRCLNRMHETVPTARVGGRVTLDGVDIYAPRVNPISVRRQVGMVFQRPTPFPTMSIRDNVAAGLRVLGRDRPGRKEQEEIVVRALQRAAVWEEVKDRLDTSAVGLSGGQQQRLCIARALATDPAVLLLDEPTASLDPLSTQKVEELVYELRRDVMVVVVTHNMQQAARVSDRTAFMLAGELIEFGRTDALFTNPRDPRTEAYITGRFG